MAAIGACVMGWWEECWRELRAEAASSQRGVIRRASRALPSSTQLLCKHDRSYVRVWRKQLLFLEFSSRCPDSVSTSTNGEDTAKWQDRRTMWIFVHFVTLLAMK